MEYRELPAGRALANEVACVWYDNRVRSSAEHRAQLVMPDGCIDIVWMRGCAPTVAGPATLPILAALPSDATVHGLRFRTGRARAFLGLPADAMLNANVPLREIWGDVADRLHDDLESTSGIADALATLQAAVRLQRAEPADTLVETAVHLLQHVPRGVLVRELGDTLGLSERQLLRRFSAAVGFGPRTLARVLRFRRFLGLLRDQRARGWDLARLAAETGFADHAHLARDCAALAGLSPSQLRQMWVTPEMSQP